jgi:hypothetical protein
MEPTSIQLESLVFNTLRKRYGANLFYMRNGYEIDFFIPGEAMIQACYSLAEPITRKREISGLLQAFAKNPVKSLHIITYQTEELIVENGVTIHVIPAWKWLLSEKF